MNTKRGSRVSRRDVLRGGVCGAAGLVIGSGLLGRAEAAAPTGKAKSVIQLWMWGGPPHLDTFDPKPDSGEPYHGPLGEVVETNVPGVKINAALPLLAQQADKYSIIRSMTHGINGHETAAYITQTARNAGGRTVYPSIGAVVSLFKGYKAGYKGLIPPYVVLTRPQGRFSEAGFLGSSYKPFATGGDPARPVFIVEGIAAPGISRERQELRRGLLHKLDALNGSLKGNPKLAALRKCEDNAYDLILGEAGKVFDLSGEDQELREQYGLNTFGQSCLVARRLVESGIPYVTINYGGWDTHKENFKAMRTKLPQLDGAMATLLQDLSDRKLLDSTIVWWGGEFGRTPKIAWGSPWNGGRHHFGACFSSVLAGGGFKGGQVVGESDAKGETVKERPVYPCDVIGSIYEQLGIDPDGTLPHPQNQAIHLTPRKDEGYKMGGRLNELV
ncbi:MAG: DUF1501 domain-containing protein [Candidatus Brocadiae bacterium]|nr:DUF1501 domain-containing protein [Candidatus Brocadiia bacterium]